MKNILLLVVACAQLILLSCDLAAHSGRTDSNGGHHDRRYGGYHYHNGGYSRAPSVRRYSYQRSSSTRTRNTYRSSNRSTKVKTARTKVKTARTISRRPKTSTYANAFYVEFDKSTNFTDNGDCHFKLIEVSTADAVKQKDNLKFVVVDDFVSYTNMFEFISDVRSELPQIINNSGVSSDSRFFLNGMPASGKSWAHLEMAGDKSCVWVRDVQQFEFSTGNTRLKNEFRTWRDSSGAFEIIAAFQFQISDKVVLIKKNGRRIFVQFKKLSAEDQDYLKALKGR